MTAIQGFELPPPPTDFWMIVIPSLLKCDDAPNGVELTVLPEKVISTQQAWR